ncbi:hypothetical protein [Loktanella sp. M215]|uniref:hypothetical protein n=1 Tax=Loktanella sp. M215 TaxID=2675431 RepID=UPI001F1CC638|nr:hypothetical protein [Loktanella sp. M215]MCF7699939.1 hypothetical protein [Loktanella sp. M215]
MNKTSTIFASDDRIAASIITALNADIISLSEATRRSGLGKQALHRAVACMIHLGIAPDLLLRFKSIGVEYERYENVFSADIATSSSGDMTKMREKLNAAQRCNADAERQLNDELRISSVIDATIETPVSDCA